MSNEFPPVALTPPPGVVKSESDRSVEGRWTDTQWMRFVDGKPQKMGGYTVQTDTAASGMLRQMHAWRDLSSVEYMAGGTYRKLYVYERDFTQHDITPLASSGTLGTDPFAVTDGSTTVTVTHAAHGRNAGDTVIYDAATAGGGITIDGTYSVVTVPGAGSYTITHSAAATSTDATTGGAAVTYEYEVSIGVEYGAYGLGYGVGGYGLGGYGEEHSGSTVFIEPRIWSFDHFGRVLLAAYNGGAIYDWDPSDVPAWGRAAIVADAPTDVRYMFITEERFVVALCEDMRVDWCTQGDYTNWTPATGNTANTRTLSEGTKLIAGVSLGNHISCIWSDFALYVLQYTGSSSVFSSRVAGKNCGLVSPSCKVTANGIAYWMGHTTFYLYNGSVQQIPNVADIRDYIFDNFRNTDGYGFLAWGQYLAKFNEIIWCYVALADTDPSYYVLLNLKDFSWATGTLDRVSGAAFSHGDTRPYFAGSDGHIYLHEDGVDADGAAIRANITLGPSSLQAGAAIFNIDGINADFYEQAGDISATFTAYDRLRSSTVDTQTVTIETTDDLIDLRLSGRYISMQLVSDVVGGYFRFGKPDVMVSSNGTRR